VTDREDFIRWVEGDLRDAGIALHDGDAGPRRALWSRTEPVSVLGAWRNVSGQEELEELFAYLAGRFSECTSFEFELVDVEVRGDTAYTVGFEHTSASVDGVPHTYTLRVTQIYRHEDGAWRVAHRHGSTSPDQRLAP
jgi:ketosteroid isomerase-like protein